MNLTQQVGRKQTKLRSGESPINSYVSSHTSKKDRILEHGVDGIRDVSTITDNVCQILPTQYRLASRRTATCPRPFDSIAPRHAYQSRSLDFYRRVLGCEPGHLEADPPVYATLHRDDVTIHLALDPDGEKAGSNSCCVFVKNVDALYEACAAAGARITREIEDSLLVCAILTSQIRTAT